MVKSQLWVKQICLPSILSNVTNHKMNFEKLFGYKFSKTTILIRLKIFPSFPSVTPHFVFAESLIPRAFHKLLGNFLATSRISSNFLHSEQFL